MFVYAARIGLRFFQMFETVDFDKENFLHSVGRLAPSSSHFIIAILSSIENDFLFTEFAIFTKVLVALKKIIFLS